MTQKPNRADKYGPPGDDYRELADRCGVPITSGRVAFHLACLSVDSEWQADEVKQYIKQLEADRDGAREMLAKCECALSRANAYGAQADKELEQASSDRDTLAAEVRAWRKWKSRVMRYITAEMPDPQPIIDNLKKSKVDTDTSGALDRAKEVK